MSPATRYKFAAVVFVGAAILVTLCGRPAAAQADRSSELQGLVNDLGYQLELVEQFDRPAAERRSRQLAIALDRWNTSTRNQQDFEIMQQWLQQSIQASLPGRAKAIPELPWFSQRLARQEHVRTPPQDDEPLATDSRSAGKSIPQSFAPVLPPQPAVPNEEQQVGPAQVAPAESKGAVASAWKRHPAARPIDLGNPFADDQPLAAGNTSTARVAMRPVPLAVRPASSTRVDINVAELGARVRGYVHGLRGVEARLLASPDMTSEELLGAVRELKQLAGQREFVSLYLEALAPTEKSRTAELPSPNQAKVIVNERLESLRRAGQLTTGAAETLESLLQEI